MFRRAQNEVGIISPVFLFLVVIIGILFYIIVASSFPLKDRLLGMLYQKDSSYAAGIVDLELIPNNPAVGVNQTFLVDVVIHAKTDQPTAAQFVLNYDPTVLQATQFVSGYYFNKNDVFGAPQIDNTNGRISALFTQGPLPVGCAIVDPNSCYFDYKTGTGTIATIEFRALKATSPSSAIQFDTTNTRTQIASLNKVGDQLGTITNSTVTVSATPAVNRTGTYTLSPANHTTTSTNEFAIQIRANSSTDAANLFNANLSFNPALLEVSRIDTNGSFVSQWYNDVAPYDNGTGRVSLAGGVPNPGYKSPAGGATMATVYFKAKASGNSEIRVDGSSAIYRNSDNVNILASSTNSTISASLGTTPTPTPSPTSAPTAQPTVQPSVTAQPSTTAQPSSSAVATATPAPSSSPNTCTITGATWVASANPIAERSLVNLKVTASGNCTNSQVALEIFEDDGFLGSDPVTNRPTSPVRFNANNEALASWLTEFQTDGVLGVNNPPEYYFNAQLVGNDTIVRSASPLLTVNQAGQGGTGTLRGDANKNGVNDWGDLSVLLSNWNKTQDFADEIDLNEDGVLNAFDAVIMVQLIRLAQGI